MLRKWLITIAQQLMSYTVAVSTAVRNMLYSVLSLFKVEFLRVSHASLLFTVWGRNIWFMNYLIPFALQ